MADESVESEEGISSEEASKIVAELLSLDDEKRAVVKRAIESR